MSVGIPPTMARREGLPQFWQPSPDPRQRSKKQSGRFLAPPLSIPRLGFLEDRRENRSFAVDVSAVHPEQGR